MTLTNWQGVGGPAGIPKRIIDRISAEIEKLVAKPDTKEKLHALGSEPFYNNPQQTAALIRSDIDKAVDWLGGKEFRRGWRGVFAGVPGGSKLFVGEKGVTISADYTASITWDDLVGIVEAPDGQVTLIGADSQQIDLRAEWFSNGREAIDSILHRAGEGRRFTPALT